MIQRAIYAYNMRNAACSRMAWRRHKKQKHQAERSTEAQTPESKLNAHRANFQISPSTHAHRFNSIVHLSLGAARPTDFSIWIMSTPIRLQWTSATTLTWQLYEQRFRTKNNSTLRWNRKHIIAPRWTIAGRRYSPNWLDSLNAMCTICQIVFV